MRCVWLKAVERAPKTPWAHEINDLRPPVDNRLWGTSSWRNFVDEARQADAEGLACPGLRTPSRRDGSSSPPSSSP